MKSENLFVNKIGTFGLTQKQDVHIVNKLGPPQTQPLAKLVLINSVPIVILVQNYANDNVSVSELLKDC